MRRLNEEDYVTVLYCGNLECGVYLGSLGESYCSICGWQNQEKWEHEEEG